MNFGTFCIVQVENNRSTGEYVFNHHNMARRALKNIALGLSSTKLHVSDQSAGISYN